LYRLAKRNSDNGGLYLVAYTQSTPTPRRGVGCLPSASKHHIVVSPRAALHRNGRFQKVKSGNPGGRPKATHSIQELARKHAPEAIKTFADIAKKGTPGARVSAAIALLDRAYGKAPTFRHLGHPSL
jgi:hypothetical protein